MSILEIDPSTRSQSMGLIIGALEIDSFKILENNYDLSPIIEIISQTMHSSYTIQNIKDTIIIAKYRAFYWKKLKIDPTKIRPASEALIRRILKNKSIPKISPFVDAYNWASIISLIPMGGYDIDRIHFPIKIRFTGENETFHPIGKPPQNLPENTLVTSDAAKQILCQYPYRDSQVTMVTPKSSKILLLAYGIEGLLQKDLTFALEKAKEHLDFLAEKGIIEYHSKKMSFFQSK